MMEEFLKKKEKAEKLIAGLIKAVDNINAELHICQEEPCFAEIIIKTAKNDEYKIEIGFSGRLCLLYGSKIIERPFSSRVVIYEPITFDALPEIRDLLDQIGYEEFNFDPLNPESVLIYENEFHSYNGSNSSKEWLAERGII